MDRLSAEHRYRNDAAFHELVDYMTSAYMQLQFTPSDMREAAIFAAQRAEAMTIRPIMFPPAEAKDA